jgi:diadenosine tetraphosphate (Ap4A) HIT family hydrolase
MTGKNDSTMTDFALHPQLAADTLEVGHYKLCRVLLMMDATYPWLVLVPQRRDIREIHELPPADRTALMEEIVRTTQALQARYNPTKLNVAALGNMVAQLHMHVIARFATDPAWPGPVWGKQPPVPYTEEQLASVKAKLQPLLEQLA